MRPSRSDIAVPPFPPSIDWVGNTEPRIERLAASGPVLVHFFDFAQLNSLRALPYLRAWRKRYRGQGLALLGVHSPRFPFTRTADAVAEAAPRLGIDWPLAVDAELRIWRDYGCRGWPSLFLWGVGGALRWYHRGEGEYEETERAIRAELAESPPEGEWPPLLEPLRPGDAAGDVVMPPTPELTPGGSLERPWQGGSGRRLEISYEAAGVYAAVDGSGELTARLDGDRAATIEVSHRGLYELAAHQHHERHALELRASAQVAVYSLQFAPGPRADPGAG